MVRDKKEVRGKEGEKLRWRGGRGGSEGGKKREGGRGGGKGTK